jgi:hypothetical protein
MTLGGQQFPFQTQREPLCSRRAAGQSSRACPEARTDPFRIAIAKSGADPARIHRSARRIAIVTSDKRPTAGHTSARSCHAHCCRLALICRTSKTLNFFARKNLRENSRKASTNLKNSPTTLHDDFCDIAK